MSNYKTEEEQLAELKEWWKQNATAILVGISIGLAALFGWKAWQNYQKRVIAESSVQYTQVLEHLQEKRYAEVVSTADLLIKDYARSPYAALSSLAKAKAQVSLEQLDAAVESAQQAASIARSKDIQAIAQLRLAQLYIGKSDYAAGLAVLETIEVDEFISQADALKGDIYLAQGDKTAAISAYKNALDAELTPQLRVITKLKYENLAGRYEASPSS